MAPQELCWKPTELTVFLAGSIEMGTAPNWQEEVLRQFEDTKNVVILNPRRDDWDSSWEQSIENPQFYEQVTWELAALRKANFILLYLVAGTKSPISLLELGLHARHEGLIVVCDEGFWRKGNVDVVCEAYDIEQQDTLTDAVATIKQRLRSPQPAANE